eukprot:Unigene6193_Nuclearia_a/m.19056 Unigene6193_Nuclearia_a/g.19056  ORF Unigene6193_Nuclearia_a/g.19056 Unigene6193_Nuclearia_a/m.19056 type:complete len:310 (+) Unigene6193_Nuclearia_a:3391-4320(+)
MAMTILPLGTTAAAGLTSTGVCVGSSRGGSGSTCAGSGGGSGGACGCTCARCFSLSLADCCAARKARPNSACAMRQSGCAATSAACASSAVIVVRLDSCRKKRLASSRPALFVCALLAGAAGSGTLVASGSCGSGSCGSGSTCGRAGGGSWLRRCMIVATSSTFSASQPLSDRARSIMHNPCGVALGRAWRIVRSVATSGASRGGHTNGALAGASAAISAGTGAMAGAGTGAGTAGNGRDATGAGAVMRTAGGAARVPRCPPLASARCTVRRPTRATSAATRSGATCQVGWAAATRAASASGCTNGSAS